MAACKILNSIDKMEILQENLSNQSVHSVLNVEETGVYEQNFSFFSQLTTNCKKNCLFVILFGDSETFHIFLENLRQCFPILKFWSLHEKQNFENLFLKEYYQYH